MKTSFFLKDRGKENSPIFARITWNGKTLKVYPGETINPIFWDKTSQRAKQTKKFPAHPEFNQRLNNVQNLMENTYRQYKNDNGQQEPTLAELKILIDAVVHPERVTKDHQKTTFLQYFAHFIERSMDGTRIKKGKASQGTVYNTNKGYLTTLRHIETFAATWSKELDFATVDLEFYNDYTKHLTQVAKLSTNTIGDHIKRIKAVLHDATANGIETNPAFTSPYFNKTKEQTDSIYLTEAELQAMADLDLSKNRRLDAVRDMFLIGCYTGQRYSDWTKITPRDVKAGMIEIVQQKTETKIAIPIHPIVMGIFRKHDGNLPKLISNQKFNEAIKDVAKMVPALHKKESKTITKGGQKLTRNYEKWQLVTSHSSRRSFATLQYLAGVPTVTIMAVTAHLSEQAFLSYIKLTKTEHAKLLQLHWDQQMKHSEKLKAV